MNNTKTGALAQLGFSFIPSEFLKTDRDEYRFRDERGQEPTNYRRLTRKERKVLIRNGNNADDWNNILVAAGFKPSLVKSSSFFGLVRIGAHSEQYLEFHDLRLPVGIYNSTIVSSDIGNNSAISHVHYLSHYIIGNEVLLFNIDEMLVTNHAKFGNGITKDGEDEDVRIWLEIGNENAGRSILPFQGLMPADAYIWSRFRENDILIQKLKGMTNRVVDGQRGHYGAVGEGSVIKSCRIIKDVLVGECAYIKGANKLKNLTIMSKKDAVTQIGEGVELVNGIVDIGCRIFYGVKAVRFYLRTNASLKYGARLINSILGDNGTISCCEVLNSLVYPSHEQHHNNSFLCAATVLGQSNIAAGATIGSNHNSRANDGELVAGRGFWPGLCVSLKHPSKFASFCLIVKGSYPAELEIPLPFTLVANDTKDDRLVILPGYWFLYNMYALTRNSWKCGDRDLQLYKWQTFEYNYLAPDTAEELAMGIEILEKWVALAQFEASHLSDDELIQTGRRLFLDGAVPSQIVAPTGVVESGRREIVISKINEGYRIYREMLHFYGIDTLVRYMRESDLSDYRKLFDQLDGSRRQEWVNIGGQLITRLQLNTLFDDIITDRIDSWEGVHRTYEQFAEDYSREKARHALASLLWLHETAGDDVDKETWDQWISRAAQTKKDIQRKTRESRQKDYESHFRQMMYDSPKDMDSVLGKLEDNSFIREMEYQSEPFT